jgi:drug/metabolite transporter (DMT)-like permease
MAAFNMSAGVVCVALVARVFLREPIRRRQWLGFALMACAVVLIRYR